MTIREAANGDVSKKLTVYETNELKIGRKTREIDQIIDSIVRNVLLLGACQ